jgi:hypothetical protein
MREGRSRISLPLSPGYEANFIARPRYVDFALKRSRSTISQIACAAVM